MANTVHTTLSGDPLLAAALFDAVDILVVVTDIEGRIVLFNTACQELTGCRAYEVIGQTLWHRFVESDDQAATKEHLTERALARRPFKFTNRWRSKLGETRQIEWSSQVISDQKNRAAYVVTTGIDVTAQIAALNEAKRQLEEIADRDGLTGLFNRRYFESTLHNEIRRTMRHSGAISLLLCDIDFFRDYNENYSHAEGDNCLREIAGLILQRFQRAGDVVARSGGDEFGVILPDTTADEAYELAQSLRSIVWERELPHQASPVADRITISLGVATYHADYKCDAEAIIKLADKALYTAKFDGRNRIVLLQLP